MSARTRSVPLDTAGRKGKHGGRPPVITDDMLHTVLRRRALGASVEQIQPDPINLIIPGRNPGPPISRARAYPRGSRARAGVRCCGC